MRDLEAESIAGDGRDPVTCRRDERRIVRELGIGDGVGRTQDVAPESLRGLRRPQLGTIDHADDLVAVDALDRVDHGKNGDSPPSGPLDGLHDPGEDLGRGQRAGRVVHEHDLDIAPERGETRGDRLLTSIPTGDDAHALTRIARGRERLCQGLAGTVHGCDDDHLGVEGTAEHTVKGMTQHRVLVDPDECLRKVFTETGPRPAGDDNDRDPRHGLRHEGGFRQLARTSSSSTLAFSSSVFSASASSETRICLALASMRFSPADRPRS